MVAFLLHGRIDGIVRLSSIPLCTLSSSKPARFATYVLYFGYMGLASLGLFMMTGFIGVISLAVVQQDHLSRPSRLIRVINKFVVYCVLHLLQSSYVGWIDAI